MYAIQIFVGIAFFSAHVACADNAQVVQEWYKHDLVQEDARLQNSFLTIMGMGEQDWQLELESARAHCLVDQQEVQKRYTQAVVFNATFDEIEALVEVDAQRCIAHDDLILWCANNCIKRLDLLKRVQAQMVLNEWERAKERRADILAAISKDGRVAILIDFYKKIAASEYPNVWFALTPQERIVYLTALYKNLTRNTDKRSIVQQIAGLQRMLVGSQAEK